MLTSERTQEDARVRRMPTEAFHQDVYGVAFDAFSGDERVADSQPSLWLGHTSNFVLVSGLPPLYFANLSQISTFRPLSIGPDGMSTRHGFS